jgi:hypothetical protein
VRLLVVLALTACRAATPATSIVVTVDSTFGVPCVIDTLHFDFDGVGEDVPLAAGDLPGSITLVPRSGAKDVTVTVTGVQADQPFASATGDASFASEEQLELRFLLDRSCVPGPCPAVGVGGYTGLPAPAAARDHCGDAGYHIATSSFAIRDACELPVMPQSVLATVNDGEATLGAMPFRFSLYGTTYDPSSSAQVWVGTDGYLTLGSQPMARNADIGNSRPLDTPGFDASGVLAFWDDLTAGPAGICYAVTGSAPDRMMWVTWKEACFKGGACASGQYGTLTFGIALQETTNKIFVGYPEIHATGTLAADAMGVFATIGITKHGPRGCAATDCVDGTCADGTPCNYTQYSAQMALSPFPAALELDPL